MDNVSIMLEGLKGNELSVETARTTKKQVNAWGSKVATRHLEQGDVDPYQVMTVLARMREFIAGYESELRAMSHPDYICEGHTINGVEFKTKNGAKKINFSEDPKYLELELKMKERKELLKTSAMIEDEVIDSGGEAVPKVSITHGKDSLTIKF